MENNLSVSGQNFTGEIIKENNLKFPLLVKWMAHFFSFIFHPLFIPTIATWFLAFVQPGYFTGIDPKDKWHTVMIAAINTIFFPLITVLLLKAVGFIKSIYLRTSRERIIPYITTNIFYFWIFLVFKHQPEIPVLLTSFMFGIFIASSAGLIANIFFKISMHALGMGSLCALLLIIIFSGFTYPVFLTSMLTFLIVGLVGTSRLIVSDHTPFEIYSGILIGILCQVVAFAIFV